MLFEKRSAGQVGTCVVNSLVRRCEAASFPANPRRAPEQRQGDF
jgi:hypothetical protein